MKKDNNDLKILFLQARDDDMKEHEFLCFDRLIDIPQENFIRVDVMRDFLDPEILEEVDAVILAGTGHYFHGGDHPEKLPGLIEFVKEIHKRSLPMLAIGYGHQVVAMAFGGEVVQNKKLREIGTVEMERTVDGVNDQIFQHLPDKFFVQIGHNHSVTVPPPGTLEIVTNHKNNCCEVFVFNDRPIYAIQFHPELEHKDVVVRMSYYKKKYFEQGDELDQVIAQSRETPEANKILNLFLDQVVNK
ncbi:MAG: gamma-glutamyl-gamma-aminobutyrate hydrolase family protein [Candidatus Uhrbacteria bacterium]